MNGKDILRVAAVCGVVAVAEAATLGLPVIVHNDQLRGEGVRPGVELVSIPRTDFAREWGLNNWGLGINADIAVRPGVVQHVMVRLRTPQELLTAEK